MQRTISAFAFGVSFFLMSAGVGYDEDLWSALNKGNHLVLMRHALAPGYGDPEHFDVKDCKTQRNSNDERRYQLKKLETFSITWNYSRITSLQSMVQMLGYCKAVRSWRGF